MNEKILDFEEPLYELYEKITQLKELSKDGKIELEQEIERIEKRAEKLKKEIYSNLTPYQIVQLARHPNRPDSLNLIHLICDKVIPLQGDRLYKDDPSIIGGLGLIKDQKVVFIGHQKGHDTKENIYRNFGMPHPEGYRKALRLMKLAEKFSLPVVTFIDTPGAYPGLEAEERGQASAIAVNLKEMSVLRVPILSFIIGEGGSGGALAIGVSNKLFMLENSVYSVISPEGCASILFRDSTKSELASKNLKMTAPDVLKLGITDKIVKEPLGGAHVNWKSVASNMRKLLISELNHYKTIDEETLLNERYEKFRVMGKYSVKL